MATSKKKALIRNELKKTEEVRGIIWQVMRLSSMKRKTAWHISS